MKKLFVFGAVLAVMGMSSCRTYCPAYAKSEVKTEQTKVQAATASDKIQG